VGITKFEGKLITKVYRKPTHTQQYINWRENSPRQASQEVDESTPSYGY
jgi:hypothetical protein